MYREALDFYLLSILAKLDLDRSKLAKRLRDFIRKNEILAVYKGDPRVIDPTANGVILDIDYKKDIDYALVYGKDIILGEEYIRTLLNKPTSSTLEIPLDYKGLKLRYVSIQTTSVYNSDTGLKYPIQRYDDLEVCWRNPVEICDYEYTFVKTPNKEYKLAPEKKKLVEGKVLILKRDALGNLFAHIEEYKPASSSEEDNIVWRLAFTKGKLLYFKS